MQVEYRMVLVLIVIAGVGPKPSTNDNDRRGRIGWGVVSQPLANGLKKDRIVMVLNYQPKEERVDEELLL